MATETCRDLEHNNYGVAAIINAAETAKLQGVDLYGEQRERITKAMEFQTQYQNGKPVPPWLCDGELKYLGTNGTLDIGYNEYAVRESMVLPQTRQFLETTRPTIGRFHYLWETLTHGLTGLASSDDNTPPSPPGNLQLRDIRPTFITMSWTASTDNVGVTGYEIRYNSPGSPVTTDQTGHHIGGLVRETAYTFEVRAYDAAGNKSNPAVISVTTPR